MPYHPTRWISVTAAVALALGEYPALWIRWGRSIPINDAQDLVHHLEIIREQVPWREWKMDDPLTKRYIGKYFFGQHGCRLGYMASPAAGTEFTLHGVILKRNQNPLIATILFGDVSLPGKDCGNEFFRMAAAPSLDSLMLQILILELIKILCSMGTNPPGAAPGEP